MAVPSYTELLATMKIESNLMEQRCSDHHLRELSLTLDAWEVLATFLLLPDSEIAAIRQEREPLLQKQQMLRRWKQRCGPAATYKILVSTLLQIGRTDMAETVIALQRRSSTGIESPQNTHEPTKPSKMEPQMVGRRIEDISPQAASMIPASLLASPCIHTAQNTVTALRKLQLDGKIMYDNIRTKSKAESGKSSVVPATPWYKTGIVDYSVCGGRDILIIFSDSPLPHPEVVARRPGQLTKEDKLKLLIQGVPPDCQDDVDIVTARYKLDKRCKIVRVKSGTSLSREEVMKSIGQLLTTTNNDGVVLYYVGAGKRNTGDWCFQHGFITFRDIAQLYLLAISNMKCRVLTIVSDCSYSGCWMKDCMEFLDEQGVQPCGHKAREKGMLIKVYTSCKSNEIPTQYCYSMNGTDNDSNTGEISFWLSEQLLATQTTDGMDSSWLHCKSKRINQLCTLHSDYTWKTFREKERIFLVRGKDQGRYAWHYVLVVDDEDALCKFKEKLTSGTINVEDFGQILYSGWGRDPPNELEDKIHEKYWADY